MGLAAKTGVLTSKCHGSAPSEVLGDSAAELVVVADGKLDGSSQFPSVLVVKQSLVAVMSAVGAGDRSTWSQDWWTSTPGAVSHGPPHGASPAWFLEARTAPWMPRSRLITRKHTLQQRRLTLLSQRHVLK